MSKVEIDLPGGHLQCLLEFICTMQDRHRSKITDSF